MGRKARNKTITKFSFTKIKECKNKRKGESKLKRKVAIVALLILTIVGSFAAGAAASKSGLLNGIWGQMKTDIKSNTDSLIENLNNELAAQVEERLSEVVNLQTNRATTEIQQHYDEVIGGVKTNPQVNKLSNELALMTTGLISEEKGRIDIAVSEALGQ